MTSFSEAPIVVSQAGAGAAPAISGGSEAPMEITRAQVEQALQNVLDPELGMSIMDLGLVYGIEIGPERVAITMTLTVPGCPIHDAMADWVREAVGKKSG